MKVWGVSRNSASIWYCFLVYFPTLQQYHGLPKLKMMPLCARAISGLLVP